MGSTAFDEKQFEENIEQLTVGENGDVDVQLTLGRTYHWKNWHLHYP